MQLFLVSVASCMKEFNYLDKITYISTLGIMFLRYNEYKTWHVWHILSFGLLEHKIYRSSIRKKNFFHVRTFSPWSTHSVKHVCYRLLVISTLFLIFNYWDVACVCDTYGTYWGKAWSGFNMRKVFMLLPKLCFSN